MPRVHQFRLVGKGGHPIIGDAAKTILHLPHKGFFVLIGDNGHQSGLVIVIQDCVVIIVHHHHARRRVDHRPPRRQGCERTETASIHRAATRNGPTMHGRQIVTVGRHLGQLSHIVHAVRDNKNGVPILLASSIRVRIGTMIIIAQVPWQIGQPTAAVIVQISNSGAEFLPRIILVVIVILRVARIRSVRLRRGMKRVQIDRLDAGAMQKCHPTIQHEFRVMVGRPDRRRRVPEQGHRFQRRGFFPGGGVRRRRHWEERWNLTHKVSLTKRGSHHGSTHGNSIDLHFIRILRFFLGCTIAMIDFIVHNFHRRRGVSELRQGLRESSHGVIVLGTIFLPIHNVVQQNFQPAPDRFAVRQGTDLNGKEIGRHRGGFRGRHGTFRFLLPVNNFLTLPGRHGRGRIPPTVALQFQALHRSTRRQLQFQLRRNVLGNLGIAQSQLQPRGGHGQDFGNARQFQPNVLQGNGIVRGFTVAKR
mmetsp:Transcript_504/g.1005  ORF Transcript_504/g.1005 Transcript_504/m.1005 type:complete len:475 (-) Transcript_504:172-1596(-)